MSAPCNANPCCSTDVTTSIPGAAGQPCYTLTTAAFTVPAVGGSVIINVVTSSIFAVGQTISVGYTTFGTFYAGGNYLITNIDKLGANQLTVNFLGLFLDPTPAASIPSGAKIVPTGSTGNNAYSTTLANTVIIAGPATTTVTMSSTAWLAVGNVVIISGTGGYARFRVSAITNTISADLVALAYPGDTAGTISTGAIVSPAGETSSLTNSIPNGFTGATTKAGAQASLGLGQTPLISNASGLTQAITATPTIVGALQNTISAVGSWLYIASVGINFAGTTFAASRTITAKIRNITQGVDLATAVKATQIQTTANTATSHINIPIVVDATAAASDVLQVWISIDVINTAGTLTVIEGSFAAIPLALS